MIDPFYDSQEWLDVRYRALERSRGICECCGVRGEPDNPLHVDHIHPRSKFPKLALVLSNLQVLCKRCNLGKGNKSETDWRGVPSRELSIINGLDPEKRFRLQQLGWLRLNADSKQLRREANKEYRKLWQRLECEWLAAQGAAR